MASRGVEKGVAFGLVVTGLLVVGMSGELSFPVLLLAVLLMGVAWFRWSATERGRAATLVWNSGLVAVLLLLAAAAVLTGNWLLHMLHFALVMTVAKLFWVRRARDLLQLYALSFVLVVAGAVMNPGLSFAFGFLLYVVLLTWGLVILHLRREGEAQEDARRRTGGRSATESAPARRIVTGRFLAGTSVLAIVIFFSSLIVFFFFPRLGLGFFFAKTRSSRAVSGFGNDVELGHFGNIRDDEAVVMRVELPDEPPQPGRRLRVRGMSFDAYDGRRWSKTERFSRLLPLGPRAYFNARPEEAPRSIGALVRQEIYLEPLEMGRRVVFAMPDLVYVKRPNDKIEDLREQMAPKTDAGRLRFVMDAAGDVTFAGGSSAAALRYTALSDIRGPAARDVAADAPVPEEIAETYLDLPEGLDARISELARSMTVDAETPYERAVAIERALQSDWDYSLQGGHDPADPLADFLFSRKEGHCEYFATAMAVLGRAAGVPTRVVNGFYGGVWNRFGQYYAIRQADAHSWVEAYMPGAGWITFDPTPAANRYAFGGSGILAEISAWVDALRLRWYKWVIEYDLAKQIEALRGIADVFRSIGNPFKGLGKKLDLTAIKDALKRAAKPQNLALAALVVAAIVLWIRFRRRRRPQAKSARARRRRDEGEVLRLFQRVEQRLARDGVIRAPSATPRELVAELTLLRHPATPEVAAAVAALEEVRWGGRPLDANLRETLMAARRAV